MKPVAYRLRSNIGPFVAAGTLLGIGMGGFVDGILFHQILQWHQMLSSVIPPSDLVAAKVNMVWDGMFHAIMWATTMTGILLFWRAASQRDLPRSSELLMGSLALGWGSFNVVEGVIDHEVFGLHHVHPGAHQVAWDLGFLLFGALLAALGWRSIERVRARVSAEEVRDHGSL